MEAIRVYLYYNINIINNKFHASGEAVYRLPLPVTLVVGRLAATEIPTPLY